MKNKLKYKPFIYKGKVITEMKKHELLEYIYHLVNNPIKSVEEQPISGYYNCFKAGFEAGKRTKEETEQAIHRNKAKLTRRERLLQKDDEEMLKAYPPMSRQVYANNLNEKPKKSLWSRIITSLKQLLP